MIFRLRTLGPLVLLLCSLLNGEPVAGQTGRLGGTVLDPSGAAIPGAEIILSGGGKKLETKSGADGRYVFRELEPGAYAIAVWAKGFAQLKIPDVKVGAGEMKELNLPLAIAVEKQEVTVASQNQQVSVAQDQNASATILRGSALNALSDDPNELENELQALAGPAAGPNGGEIYIDGFAGGQIPPKSSILEIRVNQNPFSAEFDRIGYGRVEIITKPGSQKFHGSVSAGGNPSAVNTANPLVEEQPSYYQYTIAGNVSGPIAKNAAYFFSGFRLIFKNEYMVDAVNPQDPSANIQEASPAPISIVSVNPRIDLQMGAANTVTLRDSFYRTYQTGTGVGQLNLPSLASNVLSEENALQLGDTILVNPHFVNETHFQWSHILNSQDPVSVAPTVMVQGAFTTGGSSSGTERDTQNNYELQNYSTATAGNQTLRFGTRLRLFDDASYSTAGANGTYTFDSIAAYQAGTPSQYTANAINNPLAKVLLFDGALFFEDDWRWKPNLSVAAGLRFEGQNRIRDHGDWGPRVALAWSPKLRGGAQPKTIIRVGYGWFYNRFTVPNTFNASYSGTPYLDQAIHNNGINQIDYVVDNPKFFNPNAPEPPSALTPPAAVPSVQTIDPHFHAALDMQVGVGVDRQLAKAITANITYLYTQGVHHYLMNCADAPAFDVASYTVTGATPAVYNYQFQSGGVYRQNQLIFNTSIQLKRFVFSGNYMINEARSDTEGVDYYPSVAQNPGLDYGRAVFGYRQRLTFLNSYTGPWGIVFASLLAAQSGTPYNVTIGSDLTGNNQFNARPTFGSCGTSGVIATQYGCLNSDPEGAGGTMIPFDLGTGPANAVYHVRISKVIGVGPRVKTAGEGLTYRQGANSVNGRGLSGSGGAAVRLDAAAPRRYNLTFVVGATNVFNMVNLGTPNGVLLSPLFNKTQALAEGPFANPTPGNRAINFQTTISF